MDIQRVAAFFMWCTIINGALLAFSVIGSVWGPETVFVLHSQWFQVPPENMHSAMYLFLGLYKIFWLVFNLVPYLALVILAKKRPATGHLRQSAA